MTSVLAEATPGPPAVAGRRRWVWLLLLAALAAAAIASLWIGSRDTGPATVLSALIDPDGSYEHRVIREMRLPRTVLGLMVGAALAVAGALIQAFTRNPLADPGILGVNAGSGFAVVIAASFFGVTTFQGYVWFAFGGAIAATAVMFVIGSSTAGGSTPLRMTLTGVAIGSVLGGIGSALILLRPSAFDATRFWSVGTVGQQSLGTAADLAPFLIVGLLVAVAAGPALNAVALGDDLARTLGVRLAATRIAVVAGLTLLAGAATAAAGPISFVGFMVPHAARWITGPDQRWIIAYSMLLGPILTLAADVLGRVVLPSGELPVGLVTVAIGAPIVMILVRRRSVSGL